MTKEQTLDEKINHLSDLLARYVYCPEEIEAEDLGNDNYKFRLQIELSKEELENLIKVLNNFALDN